jgi:bifunctional non-homologous end joining protein LigD
MAKRSPTTLTELASSLAGARKAALPVKVQLALAQTASAPPAGDNWVHEIKLDGYRMVCRKDRRDVQFLSRNHQDWTKRLGSLSREAAHLSCELAVLDGEVVVTLPDGRTSFQALQDALSDPQSQETFFYAFDLLYLNDFDLTRVKLEQRKNLLQRLIGESGLGRFVFCDHIAGDGPQVFEQAARMGVEGIVSKRRDHPYRKGRTPSWQKIKCIQSDDFVIGGYTKPSKAKYRIGAILLGEFDPQGQLVYAGRVGTGFSDSTRRMLAEEFQQREITGSPFVKLPPEEGGKDVRFVAPSLIARIEYLERGGEHNVLRHAVFRGLREDQHRLSALMDCPWARINQIRQELKGGSQ